MTKTSYYEEQLAKHGTEEQKRAYKAVPAELKKGKTPESTKKYNRDYQREYMRKRRNAAKET